MPSIFFMNMNKPEHPRSPDGKNERLRGKRSQPMFHLHRAIYAQLDHHRYCFESNVLGQTTPNFFGGTTTPNQVGSRVADSGETFRNGCWL